MTSFILISLSTWLQGPFHVHFPGEKLVGIACHKTVNMNMETILKVRGPKPKLHSEANAIYKTCLWISQILTTSCYGLPATLASLASSEVVKLQSIALLILHCIWLLLTYRLMPIWTLKVFTCLSSAPRQMVRPFPTGLLCLPWSWSCPSICCGFLGKLPSPSWAETRTSIFLPEWYSSFQIQLSAFLKSTLKSAGVPGNLSDHIFRSGAATTAASQGLPDHLIKIMGHWSSEAYLLHARTPEDMILSVAGWLA